MDWLAEGVVEYVLKLFIEATAKIIKMVVASWLQLNTPTLNANSGTVPHMVSYLTPITYVILVIAVMIAGGRIAWYQRGEDFRELATALVKLVVLVGLGTVLINLLGNAGDEYATWILNVSTTDVSGANLMDRMNTLLQIRGLAALAPGVALFLTILVILSCLAQVVMVYVRFLVLVLLVVLLPTMAAAGLTRTGRPMLNRYLAWGLAWMLWKPAAATIYAVGFALMIKGNNGSDMVAGLATIAMAVFALPALMRLIVPITSGAGSLAPDGGAMASGAIAVGAIAYQSGRSGKGGNTSGMQVTDATNGPTGAKATGAAGGKGAAAGVAGPVAAAVAAQAAVAGALAKGTNKATKAATELGQ